MTHADGAAVRQLFDSLKRAPSTAERYAPHKPLLLLLALARFMSYAHRHSSSRVGKTMTSFGSIDVHPEICAAHIRSMSSTALLISSTSATHSKKWQVKQPCGSLQTSPLVVRADHNRLQQRQR